MSSNRVTLETFYRQTIYHILRRQDAIFNLNGQIASGKRVNLPSDDPIASITAHQSHRSIEEVVQYGANVDHTQDWLKAGNSAIQGISDLLAMIKGRAEQMSTGTYTSEQRAAIATDAQNFFDQILTLANSRLGTEYIFSGSRTNVSAASSGIRAENPTRPDSANSGPAKLYGRGLYTGELSRTIEFTVDASFAGGTPSAANPMTVHYSFYDDLGRYNEGSVVLTGTGSGLAVDVGDGVQVFAEEAPEWTSTNVPVDAYKAGDSFQLTVGRHRGNSDDLMANLSWRNRMRYNYVLEQLFQKEGYSGIDLYVAEAGPNNSPTSEGLTVGGSASVLSASQLEINIGGPFQTTQADDDLVALRNYQFTVDPAYGGGVPSPANPMTVNYTYWDGTATQNGSVVITGTGRENAALLVPPAEGTALYVANGPYVASSTFSFMTFPDNTQPTPANPMPLTYTYTDDTGVRQIQTISVTQTGTAITLTPPGGVTLTMDSEGAYDDGDSWSVVERRPDGDWQNLLDMVHDWVRALRDDPRNLDAYRAVPSTSNHRASSGVIEASGSWEKLTTSQLEFNVGGPFQTLQDDDALLATRGYAFTVDAGYPGGIPSRTNPMVVNYTYNDGGPQTGTVVFTGTGPGNQATLAPPDEGTGLFVADASYTAGDAFSFQTFADNSEPSAANPMPLTYTYRGDDGLRHWQTINVTSVDTPVSLSPPDSVSISVNGTFDDGDNWVLSLEQYNVGQTKSQELLPKIGAALSHLLKYSADAGSRLNRLDVRDTILQNDNLRLFGRLEYSEDAEVTEVIAQLKTYETMYQATLQATSVVFGRSLADYL